MSDENPDHSSEDTDEELLEIEKESKRLYAKDGWVATIRAVKDLLENDEDGPLPATSLETDESNDNNDQPTTTPQPTNPSPESSSTKPITSVLKKSSTIPDEENTTLDSTSPAQQEERPPQSKKKVRFTDTDETILPADDISASDGLSNELQYVRSPKSFRLLKDIKIDLSKLIPASNRFGRREGAQIQPSPSSSPELSFPGPSSSPGPSFEDFSAIPGPSYTQPSTSGRHCIPLPFSGKGTLPNRKQYDSSSDEDSSEGPYLEPTESHCLFENTNLNVENLNDPIEWDFSDSPIKSLTVADKNTPIQYKLKLKDNDMPHIYDPKTNLFIPLKNGDKIEVVADIHPIPKKFRLATECSTTFEPEKKLSDQSIAEKPKPHKQPKEDTDRIEAVLYSDEEGSLIMHLHDEDDNLAPDNPDWSDSPSPTFRERRHSI